MQARPGRCSCSPTALATDTRQGRRQASKQARSTLLCRNRPATRAHIPSAQAKKDQLAQLEKEAGRKLSSKERMALEPPPVSPSILQHTESAIADAPVGVEVQEVSEVVNERMLRRIIAFCGIPTFTGFLLFPLFYYLKVVQKLEVPMIAVYAVQTLVFGGGFLGITYGIMSASWDPSVEGNLLGIEQFQRNAGSAVSGFLDRRKGKQ